MSIIFLLILISLAVALAFLLGFFWALRNGQFDDAYTPSIRILFDDQDSTPIESTDWEIEP